MKIVSLFDYTGIMLDPWAEAGFECFAFDQQHSEPHLARGIHFIPATFPEDLDRAILRGTLLVFGFPPCTDLAASGAKHFSSKAARNAAFQQEALTLVQCVESVASAAGAPWMLENPVGILSRLWRKPDFSFDPCDFGGYLPPDDRHPQWPDIIPPRDAYTKRTCIWHGEGFQRPRPRAVPPEFEFLGDRGLISKQTAVLGGKSLRTKNIRSATPRGFARAVFEANKILAEVLA